MRRPQFCLKTLLWTVSLVAAVIGGVRFTHDMVNRPKLVYAVLALVAVSLGCAAWIKANEVLRRRR